jgi:hypothetical protein
MNHNFTTFLEKRWATYFDSIGIVYKYQKSGSYFVLYSKLEKIVVYLEGNNTAQPCCLINSDIDIDPCYGLIIGKYVDGTPIIINNCDLCIAISLFIHQKCINCGSPPEYTKNKKIVKLLKNLWEYNNITF